MSRNNIADVNSVNHSTWSNRAVMIIGAGTRAAESVVTSFAAAGAGRIALLDVNDMSSSRDMAIRAACDSNMEIPDMLVFRLDGEDSVTLAEAAEEVSRKWGHIDIIIHHAYTPLTSSKADRDGERIDANQSWKSFEAGVRNVYESLHQLLLLLLAGSEKTLINIFTAAESSTLPGVGVNRMVELLNRQMTDSLMLDHGHEGLLAYSVHAPAANAAELDGALIVQLTKNRNEWLAGRHISSKQNVQELLSHREMIVRRDLLRYNSSLSFELPSEQAWHPFMKRRGRVPRSSF
jgi:NAD(P)-dependent dehydrogenase (short-subunit alcohol dehydrogenase family)